MMIGERTCKDCMKYECPLKKQIPYLDFLKAAAGTENLHMMQGGSEDSYKEDPETPLEQYKRIFSQYLKKHHTGEENAIFSRDLEALFQLGGRDIRRIVSSLRKDGIPICSDYHKGYYFAKKQSEIADTLKGLSEHIAGVSDTVAMLQKVKVAGKPSIQNIRIVITPEDGSDEEIILLVS